MACGDGIVVADAQQAVSPDWLSSEKQALGAVSSLAVSPNSEFVAAFVETGALVVISSGEERPLMWGQGGLIRVMSSPLCP